MEFSATRQTSETPWPASQATSSRISVGRRERNRPRNDGMAQNEQSRSQPSASLTRATGPRAGALAGNAAPAGVGNTIGSARRPAGTSVGWAGVADPPSSSGSRP